MGHGQRWTEDRQPTYSPQSWQVWSGSWPRNQRGAEQHQRQTEFPHYDAKSTTKGAQKGKKGWEEIEDENPSDPWNSALQDGLNNARKAEVRVRQLTATRQVKMRQRQQYEKKLKRSYLQERQRH